MNPIVLGLLCGLGFGIVDVLLMLPLKHDNKKKRNIAMMSAFLERFAIGFLIPNVHLPICWPLVGLIVGIGVSLPTGIVVRAFGPIVAIGAAGGLIIGFIAQAAL